MLGIIDWGIGGISVYKLLKERLGDVPVVYFSDTGATPYGKMARVELATRLDVIIEYLIERGATSIAIGCNAASTAIGDLADHGIEVEGVIQPAVELTARLKPKRLGLIGGRRTVVSGVYREAFAERGIAVKQRIAQPLSALIESGDISSEHLRAAANQIIGPLRNCSHILLACTHYPAISHVLKELVSPATEFIDPAAELVSRVEKLSISGSAEDTFLTTGDAAAMKTAALKAFGVSIPRVERVTI